jgi:hypothetical protein
MDIDPDTGGNNHDNGDDDHDNIVIYLLTLIFCWKGLPIVYRMPINIKKQMKKKIRTLIWIHQIILNELLLNRNISNNIFGLSN